jgi:hypothetical protein
VVAVVAVVGLAAALGCGPRGPKTYPVRGKVELAAGDVTQLAGNQVEAALEGDPTVRASGVIQPDGSFALETLDTGVTRKGAREGNYQARIVLADDDPAGLRRRCTAASCSSRRPAWRSKSRPTARSPSAFRSADAQGQRPACEKEAEAILATARRCW